MNQNTDHTLAAALAAGDRDDIMRALTNIIERAAYHAVVVDRRLAWTTTRRDETVDAGAAAVGLRLGELPNDVDGLRAAAFVIAKEAGHEVLALLEGPCAVPASSERAGRHGPRGVSYDEAREAAIESRQDVVWQKRGRPAGRSARSPRETSCDYWPAVDRLIEAVARLAPTITYRGRDEPRLDHFLTLFVLGLPYHAARQAVRLRRSTLARLLRSLAEAVERAEPEALAIWRRGQSSTFSSLNVQKVKV